MRILPEHWWKTRDFSNSGGFEPPLGSGPYAVSQVDPGRSISFERVKDWWGKDLPVSKGLYNFDRLTVNFTATPMLPANCLRPGLLTITASSLPPVSASVTTAPP